MSDQSANATSNVPAGAKLENLYKPVGIAALNAASVCLNFKTKKKPS
ncbi:MAG: hypothetical protein ABJQ71_16560 [Roseibium sp.]